MELENIIKLGRKLLDSRGALLHRWQDLADHFYPQRADFTTKLSAGQDYGLDLMSSYPTMMRRDLGDALSTMLRPTNKAWFHSRIKYGWDKLGVDGRAWLENADTVQRRAMLNRSSQFSRAVKEADHDFVTFGQAVIQHTMNKDSNGLLFRCHHLRDTAWTENENGVIDTVFRRWKPTVRDLIRLFPKTVHALVREKAITDPFAEMEAWHVVLPSYMCGGTEDKFSFMSYYIDPHNNHIMEEVGQHDLGYTIPRWTTISGTQYAISPATFTAIRDARMLQAMLATLYEAGEKAVNPPMVANKEVFGGNFSIYAGGITWADSIDGKVQDSFSILPVDKNGIPLGRDMAEDIKKQMANLFYANRLQLPAPDSAMTAYETGVRVQEYIRQALPLFEPIEAEYNAPLCDAVFSMLMRRGAFGSPFDMPSELHGKEVEFAFESPLHDAIDRGKMQQFSEAKALLGEAMAVDPSAVDAFDVKRAYRDAQLSSGAPSEWVRSEREMLAITDDRAQQQRTTDLLAQMQTSAETRKTVAETPAMPGATP